MPRGTDARERRGRRYRYYISQAYLKKEKDKAGNLPQIPAVNTEELVSAEIKNLLEKELSHMDCTLEQQALYQRNWEIFTTEWNLLNPKIFLLVRQYLVKLIVSTKGLEFAIDRDNIKEIGEAIFRNLPLPEELPTTGMPLRYTKLCKIEQVRHGKSFVIVGRMPEMPHLHGCKGAAEGQTHRNDSLINALKQAWEWNDWIEEGKVTSIQELSEKLGISRRYVERILNMRYLSPKIQLMILRGTQPLNWTTHTFIRAIPSDWKEQEERFHP